MGLRDIGSGSAAIGLCSRSRFAGGRRRSAPGGGALEFVRGVAGAIPCADAGDVAVSTQVYEYLEDVAVAELYGGAAAPRRPAPAAPAARDARHCNTYSAGMIG
jgi:hypothetical protein